MHKQIEFERNKSFEIKKKKITIHRMILSHYDMGLFHHACG